MKNQPNDIEMLKVLSLLSKARLSKPADGWQDSTHIANEQLISLYKTIGSCLADTELDNDSPELAITEPLDTEYYKKLLLGWRQQVQQLLDSNINQPTTLATLQKSAHYLWQSIALSDNDTADKQQPLWYLVERWLQNLADNPLPVPQDYVSLLSDLDQLIESNYNKQTLAQQTTAAIDTSQSSAVALIEQLIVDIYISIRSLSILDKSTTELISKLDQKIALAIDEGDITLHIDDDESDNDTRDNDTYDQTSSGAKVSAWQVARAQVKADVFDIDDEIRQIFVEEATEILAELTKTWSLWQQDIEDVALVTTMQQHFYDLKGSGRIIGAFSISESAWAIEKLLLHILSQSLTASHDVVALIAQVLEQLPALIDSFRVSQPPNFDPTIVILQSNNLLAGLPPLTGMPIEDKSTNAKNTALHDQLASHTLQEQSTNTNTTSADIGTHVNTDTDTDTDADTDSNDSLVTKEYLETDSTLKDKSCDTLPITIPTVLTPFIEKAADLPLDTHDADPDIKEIFIEEAHEVLAEIVPLYKDWQSESLDTTDIAHLTDIRRGFHTLKGSGRMVGAFYSAELAWAIESMLNKILDKSLVPTADMQQLIGDVLSAYPEMVETFEKSEQNYPAMTPLWVAAANAYSQRLGDDFSYSALHAQWLTATDPVESITTHERDVRHDVAASADDTIATQADSADAMLETIHSINDMMSETTDVSLEHSHEEREIFEIFIEEAKELLEQISGFIHAHQDQPYVPVSDDIVRAFHTLRAASGSDALEAISEVSTTIEKSLEHLQKHETPMNARHIDALTQSVALISGYLSSYEQNIQSQDTTSDTQSQQDVETLEAILNDSEVLSPSSDAELSIEQLLSLDIDELLDAEWKLKDKSAKLAAEPLNAYIVQIAQQISRLVDNTASSPKFSSLLASLENAYHYLSAHPQALKDSHIQQALIAGHNQLVALFDSLAGRMSLKIDQSILNNLQTAIDQHQAHAADSQYHIENNISYDIEQDSTEQSVTEQDSTEADNIEADIEGDNDADEPVASLAEKSKPQVTFETVAVDDLPLDVINTDIELLEVFLEEAQYLASTITKTFIQWRLDVTDSTMLEVLQRHLHTIKGGARMAGISSIGELTDMTASLYAAFDHQQISATQQWVSIMQMLQETLSLQLEYVARYQQSFWTNELLEQINELKQLDHLPSTVILKTPSLKSATEAITRSDAEQSEASAKAATLSLTALIEESWPNGLPDTDILEIFLEEAEELVENSQKYLQLFLNNMSDTAAVQTLQRDLHTIKGGARMIAAEGIAELAHQMESVYEALAIGRRPATQFVSELLVSCHDWLVDAVFILKHRVNPTMPTILIKALQDFSKNNVSSRHVPVESLQSQISVILAVQDKQTAVRGDIDISEMPSMEGSFAEPERSTDNSDEMIRISGGLVEHMINLSGESAINRARIDMGMSSLTGSLSEMSITVQRLTDQLRRMEIELEAQILSQIDEKLIDSDDFDPLEMDQYSSLNQLSKSLTESASDLLDINTTLIEKTRDNENLLLQLSRTQTELQDGLMNSRMVPFLRLKPRLDLIVRQTANELNKSVDLTVITADDELDRTILEHITSPLEHMLRNAVDHGIESEQERLAAGKERSGHITLEVLREGSEVVIHLSDDGRGINVDKVREKAITQGLIDPNEYQYTDLEIMQYVFNAGVTTSKNVTQISGRGVGMDVVASGIRQLGGAVSVKSQAGAGTQVTMRIPLKVAVSDALVVRVADRQYAIPLIQIERVVRVNPEELYDYYQSEQAKMSIEGKEYRVRYLNNLISGSKFNELMMNTNISLPVIIVRNSSNQKLALQVDQIVGSSIEVVVKPMGQQLSNLAGISAATIMGDGSVMPILDIIALLRQSTVKTVSAIESTAHVEIERKPTILVVDDSVTVRKVTSRFLERQGLNAVVAKDGMDAIEVLQELTPDLILLDIEMPRMDGFEVATQVRNSQRLQQIPIIMITSRTGDKHRTRAFETGVNDYMGKPFQENELLEKIQTLLDIELDNEQEV